MKAKSLHDFADRTGRKRRVIHAPGALRSWDEVAAKLPSQKANLIDGALIQLFTDWVDGARFHGRWAEPEGDLDRNTRSSGGQTSNGSGPTGVMSVQGVFGEEA